MLVVVVRAQAILKNLDKYTNQVPPPPPKPVLPHTHREPAAASSAIGMSSEGGSSLRCRQMHPAPSPTFQHEQYTQGLL